MNRKGVSESSGSESFEMVRASGKNGRVHYGQKSVDVGRKWGGYEAFGNRGMTVGLRER